MILLKTCSRNRTLDAQETYVFQTSKQHKNSAATSSAVCFVFCTDVSWAAKTKEHRLASYLMEHIYFEAQLCSEIATLKERSTNIF